LFMRGGAVGGALAAALALAGCNGLSQGTSSGPVTGAAAGSTSVNAIDSLQRCSEPLGTLAVDDGRNHAWWGPFYRNTQVTSIDPLVRLVVQQSNCFVITSLGNVRLEDRMSGITRFQRYSGEFRPGSNQQTGQRVAADYFLEPSIIFAGDTTSGLAGGLGGLGGLGGGGGSGGSGGSSGSGSSGSSGNSSKNLEEYTKCIEDAGNDLEKAQKCAEILNP